MEDYDVSPRAEAYTRHEPWSLAPWLTGMIIAVVIFVVLIPAICSAWLVLQFLIVGQNSSLLKKPFPWTQKFISIHYGLPAGTS